MKATAGVSSSNWIIGNDSYGLTQPRTLADVFPIIHQSLLVALGIRSMNNGLDKIEKPEPLAKLHELLFKTQREKQKLISMNVAENKVQLTYNQPLGAHSAQIVASYNVQTESLKFSLVYFGADEAQRWDTVEKFTLSFSQQLSRLFPSLFRIINLERKYDSLKIEVEAHKLSVALLNFWFQQSSAITFALNP